MAQNFPPTLWELIQCWSRIGLLSFGGPAAQIGLMHQEIVTRKKWLEEDEFNNALAFCMLLPGPEAMQLATYMGWKLRGILGGVITGLLFILPGAVIVGALSFLYLYFGSTEIAENAFMGLKSAVVVIVFHALFKLAARSVETTTKTVISLLSFVLLFCFQIPFALLLGSVVGFALLFSQSQPTPSRAHFPSDPTNVVRISLIWLGIWIGPILMMMLFFPDNILTSLALFFSKLAVFSFGGAYAVLAYMSQEVVHLNNWLTAQSMIDGLGLAETTPGPLILVTEFVGILTAAQMYPEQQVFYGIAGGIVTLWATFVPCFLWIFVGAPYLDWINTHPKFKAVSGLISAAIVGVILNLTVWFTFNVFFEQTFQISFWIANLTLPNVGTLLPLPIAIAMLAFVLYSRIGMLTTFAICAILPIIII